MQRRSFKWVVGLVGIAFASVIGLSAATALAARSAASPFELVATDRYEAECPDCIPPPGHVGDVHVGTFTSGAPFCASGTIDDLVGPNETVQRYTCSDGSGSLTLAERNFGGSGDRGGFEWMIVEGSGEYADLRGKGAASWEVLSKYPPAVVYRTTLRGTVDTAGDEPPATTTPPGPTVADAVAPSVAFTSASATKLRRPARAYSIHVAFMLRDDVDGNTVAYRLRVKEGPENRRDRRLPELASKEGSTASGSVSTTLRVLLSSKRVRSVSLLLIGSDPNGNEVSIARSLKLPHS